MSKPSYILGLSAYYHDSAACLLRDGEIVAAASEERFSRVKGDAAFPAQAVAWCLRFAGVEVGDLTAVGFYDKPLLKFERLLDTYLAVAPRGFTSFRKAGPLWAREKINTDRRIRASLGGLAAAAPALPFDGEVLYAEHHESHAASAFYPSPFDEAAILTIDGVGEWATASVAIGRGPHIEMLKEIHWPDSLGLLYSAFTYYLGFKVNSGEYKVMGLAPYGEPKYASLIRDHLIDLREDGSFTLDQRYFNYLAGLTMTSGQFHELFGGPPRTPESLLTQRDMDLARSVQVVCEEVMVRMARDARRETGLSSLCMAGGVALNCVGNGRIHRERIFDRIWIQPASGDAGGAIGVAQLVWHRQLGRPRIIPQSVAVGRDALPTGVNDRSGEAAFARRRRPDGMRGSLLGPEYTAAEVEDTLRRADARYDRLDRSEIASRTASLIADGAVVGWFTGRMEFGPRALGARSILGDPRDPTMQARMNSRIKFRESFRPFAPSVLREKVGEWFDFDDDSPYMLLVADVRVDRRLPHAVGSDALWGIDRLNVPRSTIPAVTHLDYTARLQTVSAADNPLYHELLRAFDRLTGCPVLINTSFNVRGEPVVCSPGDAYRCFMRTRMDYLMLDGFLLERSAQPDHGDPSLAPGAVGLD